ncbi:MAG TPA: ATP-binding cassette domain-containing protein [Actinomycetota bacterium]|nr:ATP-binding cassette domain-containing protein [Actinomycetota bacterium]
MPAKKKAAAAKKALPKKAPGKKTPRTAASAKTPAPKKKQAARKNPAKKPAAARPRVRRDDDLPPELAIEHEGAIPDAVLAAAQRTTERQLASREVRRDAAKERREAIGTEEPEAALTRLAAASVPGAVVEERMAHETHDTLTINEPEPISGVRVAPAGPAPARDRGGVVIEVENLHVFYGAVQALRGVSFRVHEGETVAIIGSNGAGKTTTLKTVSGVSELHKTVRGHITIMGRRVETWPAHKIARLGVAHSPEGRKVFPNQTVRDNLMLGAFGRRDADVERDIRRMEERFPILGERRSQPAGLMSGGEQQMLAMARALMARPRVLLFDEPSMGLAPLIVKQIFEIIQELKREGITILLVEQMAFQALAIADRGYVLETGEITMEGSGITLLEDRRVMEAYLGA